MIYGLMPVFHVSLQALLRNDMPLIQKRDSGLDGEAHTQQCTCTVRVVTVVAVGDIGDVAFWSQQTMRYNLFLSLDSIHHARKTADW
ncbi:hypothetical protein TNCV_2915491 [Trichonephila clavipes]|nr:hypothetical protein TNCV_2915491 [Trichonephila clavipes]